MFYKEISKGLKKVIDSIRKDTLMKAMYRFSAIPNKMTIAFIIYRNRVKYPKTYMETQNITNSQRSAKQEC